MNTAASWNIETSEHFGLFPGLAVTSETLRWLNGLAAVVVLVAYSLGMHADLEPPT